MYCTVLYCTPSVIALLVDIFRPRESQIEKFVSSEEMTSWRKQKRSEREMWMNFEEGEEFQSCNGTYTLTLSNQNVTVAGNNETKLNLSI